MARPEVD